MKRIVTFLLALMMIASMGSIAYADEFEGSGSKYLTDSDGSASVGITGKFEAGAEPATVYSVKITWDSMLFDYKLEDHRVWNTQTHKYDGDWVLRGEGTSARTVKVENSSNATVKIEAELSESEPKIQGVALSLRSNGVSVEGNSASQTLNDASIDAQPQIGYFSVVLSTDGTPDPAQFRNSQNLTVGTLTITVKAPSSP